MPSPNPDKELPISTSPAEQGSATSATTGGEESSAILQRAEPGVAPTKLIIEFEAVDDGIDDGGWLCI
jgi:hypothetical protein